MIQFAVGRIDDTLAEASDAQAQVDVVEIHTQPLIHAPDGFHHFHSRREYGACDRGVVADQVRVTVVARLVAGQRQEHVRGTVVDA